MALMEPWLPVVVWPPAANSTLLAKMAEGRTPSPQVGQVAADGDGPLPDRPGGQVVAVEGVEDPVLVGHREQLVTLGVGGQGRGGAPVGVGHGGPEGELPRVVVGQGAGVEGHDGLGLGLVVAGQGAGGDEDPVGGRVVGRRGPHPPPDLAVGDEVVGGHDGLGGQADLEQLALDQRVVAVRGDAHIGVAVHDERAGPVVVGPGLAVVAGVDAPQDGPGGGVERVPVGAATAHVDHAVEHGGRRGDPDGGRVAPRVGGDARGWSSTGRSPLPVLMAYSFPSQEPT